MTNKKTEFSKSPYSKLEQIEIKMLKAVCLILVCACIATVVFGEEVFGLANAGWAAEQKDVKAAQEAQERVDIDAADLQLKDNAVAAALVALDTAVAARNASQETACADTTVLSMRKYAITDPSNISELERLHNKAEKMRQCDFMVKVENLFR